MWSWLVDWLATEPIQCPLVLKAALPLPPEQHHSDNVPIWIVVGSADENSCSHRKSPLAFTSFKQPDLPYLS